MSMNPNSNNQDIVLHAVNESNINIIADDHGETCFSDNAAAEETAQNCLPSNLISTVISLGLHSSEAEQHLENCEIINPVQFPDDDQYVNEHISVVSIIHEQDPNSEADMSNEDQHDDLIYLQENDLPQQGNGHYVTRRYKYEWDDCVHSPVLPVRCKNTSGELYKDRFGSGSRGKCIKIGSNWLTPTEFELMGGRGLSKDWKRSIRFAGRSLHCLIVDGLLRPHAASCTCNSCCDDDGVLGPVRLFVPYKRKRITREGDDDYVAPGNKKATRQNSVKSNGSLDSPQIHDQVMANLPGNLEYVMKTVTSDSVQARTPVSMDSPALKSFSGGNAPLVLTIPQLPKLNPLPHAQTPIQSDTPSTATPNFDFTEQKLWWQLEEVVNTIVNYGVQLKQFVEQLKTQTCASRELALQQLKLLTDAEKIQAVNAARLSAMNPSCSNHFNCHQPSENGLSDSQSDHLKTCANCNREAFSECTGCRGVSYCGEFCQKRDWPNHRSLCQQSKLQDEAEAPYSMRNGDVSDSMGPVVGNNN